ncbi:hypothetical protein RRF57_011093 [Xylaria bambusicola]|uniref:Uncharacterized protein n=1 Tax=Xylaria bambusicola TaxID=326684 RepID=A0AAN7UZ01_9PEZI
MEQPSSSSSSSSPPPLPPPSTPSLPIQRTNNGTKRVPLPTLPSQPPPPAPSASERRKGRNRQKTAHEKQQGDKLKDDTIGIEADQPCDNCRKARGNSCPCRVARDPEKFNSWKCGHCIATKRKCSFSPDSPGVIFGPMTREGARKEDRKRKANERRCETRRTKVMAAGAPVANYTPVELEVASILIDMRAGVIGSHTERERRGWIDGTKGTLYAGSSYS